MMRRLLKIMNCAAHLLALIDIGKRHQQQNKKRNRLISQRLRSLQVIPIGLILLQYITETYVTPICFPDIYNTVEV